MRRGSRIPTRQLLISIPFFCLGFISVGLASNTLSFKAPTKTAQGIRASRSPEQWHNKVLEHAEQMAKII